MFTVFVCVCVCVHGCWSISSLSRTGSNCTASVSTATGLSDGNGSRDLPLCELGGQARQQSHVLTEQHAV